MAEENTEFYDFGYDENDDTYSYISQNDDPIENKAILEERIEKQSEKFENDDVEPGHYKPKAYPERGTLNQTMVDASVGTLSGINKYLEDMNELLENLNLDDFISVLKENQKLIGSIKVKNISLDKEELTDDDLETLCEDEESRNIIESTEMVKIKNTLESLDLNELQKLLLSIQTYLSTRMENIMEECFGGRRRRWCT